MGNIEQFFCEELKRWQTAADNYKRLQEIITASVDCGEFQIRLQFNPARIISSSAKVDAKSLAERKCFLCAQNRPSVQRGIEWGNGYIVLINPFPIFPRHLTIPDMGHVDQLIKGRIADMMSLAKELDEYTVFYNGPKCGASAPDHMHFQAGNSDFLTIGEALDGAELKTIATDGDAVLAVCDTLPLNVFVIDSNDPQAGERLFDRLYDAIPVPEGEKEPMMNLLCYATPAGVRLVVIPRKQHRPSFYGTEGDDKMLLSPASVDMGGVFITPLEKDFIKLDAELVKVIFNELCLAKEDVEEIVNKIK